MQRSSPIVRSIWQDIAVSRESGIRLTTRSSIAGPSRQTVQYASQSRFFNSSGRFNNEQKNVERTESTPNATDNNAEQSPPVPPKPTSSDAPQSSSEFAEQGKKPLPFLSAPLGMSKKPTSKKLTWTEKRERQFDHDLRIERRKAIVKEATRGYFHDVHAMRSHGGKTWIAPSTLIRQDRALYFPAISGTTLSVEKEKRNTADFLPEKVSIVCILTSQVSEHHVKSFYERTFEIFKNDSNFQLVQINLQENVLKAALVSLFMSSLRKQIEPSLHSTYLLTTQDLTVERDAIALHNKHVGYVYLVGPDGKIRWAGGGFAEEREVKALIACTGVLLTRLGEEKANSSGKN